MKNVVSFMNMKGGVSKTTLCVNIANTLATRFKKKVLLIDMDPQFNATQYTFSVLHCDNYIGEYEKLKKNNKTIYQLYKHKFDNGNCNAELNPKCDFSGLFNTNVIDDAYLKADYIVNIKENFDMILGDIELIELQITQRSGVENTLKNYIEKNDLKQKYDYILIDCPPTYSFFFISSYIASDTYIIPIKPEFVSSLGMVLLNRAISEINKNHQKDITSLGIIYTLIDPRNTLHVPVIKEIEENIDTKHIFKNNIKYFKAIPEGITSSKFMLDIVDHDIDKDIIKITEEFMARVGGEI